MAMPVAPGSSVSLHPISEVAAAGVQLILIPHLLGLAAMNAQLRVLEGIREGRLPEMGAERMIARKSNKISERSN